MKYIIFFILSTAVLFSCDSKIESPSKIKISYVDKRVTSVIRVGCDNFNSYFKPITKDTVIEIKELLDNFNQVVSTLTRSNSKDDLDVRARIVVYNAANDEDVYCIDAFGNILHNGAIFQANSKIDTLLSNISNGSW